MKRLLGFAVVISVILVFSVDVHAAGSGAFRVEVPDAEALGKGGAFVAEADNPSAIFFNPAGMTQLEGNNISIGMSIIQPFTSYEPTTGDSTQMRREVFPIPHMYYVNDFGLEKFAFGIGATSSWGLGTEWAEDSFARYSATKSDLMNKDVMLTGAYQINEKLSIGIATDYDNSYVNKKKKLLQGGTGDDGDFQLRGKAQGWGYRISTLYKINEKHQVGLQYRSAIDEKYRGKAYLNELNNAGATPYASIFGGSSYETELTSESTLPQSVVVGYSFKPSDKWRINLDIEWMDWSVVEQELIIFEDEYTTSQRAVLTANSPTPKDYKSSMSAGIGAEYLLNDKTRLRTGYLFHQTPIDEANFNPNLPDANSHSITLGFGYDLRKDMVIDMSYLGMFKETPYIDSTTTTADGRYKNFTQILTVTLGYKF